MARKAILHIGPMKTGSSSIQLWLHRRADDLAARGYHFPTSLGSRNMSRLTYMAQARAFNGELVAVDTARLDALRAEMAGLSPAVHTVIFSGEMMGQILNEPREVRALKEMLDEFFDSYLIVLYLRRQDELSLSRYSTSLRRGEKRARPFAQPFDYELVLNLWSDVFGREAIRPRIFDRDLMPSGDVVHDFAQAAGLPYDPTGEAALERNTSLLPEAQQFLAMFADAVRASGFDGQFIDIAGYDDINRFLNSKFSGPGSKPPRADAIAFHDRVRASNERVRAAWFPTRETLFNEDFSAYPEVVGRRVVRTKLVLDVAVAVLTSLTTARKNPTLAKSQARERDKDRAPRVQIRREKRRRKSSGDQPNQSGDEKRPL